MYIIISGQLKFKCCSIRRVDIVLGVPDVGYLHPKVGHDRFSSVLFMANNTADFALSLSPRFLAMSVYKEKKTNKTHKTLWDFHWKKADPTEDTRDITPSRKSGGKWRNGLWLSLKTSEASITVFSEPAPIPMASAKQNKKVNDVWIKERLYTPRLTL